MATDKNYPIDLPILVIHAQIFVAVKKFPFLPNKQIPKKEPSPYLYKLRESSLSADLTLLTLSQAPCIPCHVPAWCLVTGHLAIPSTGS